jgi:dihydroflavonol-4-reductase
MTQVLVTGGSGFVGGHAIVQLLAAGYEVRTTVRSLERVDKVRAMVREGGVEPGERLRFATADLTRDEGWGQAVEGCSYILHVASPFPGKAPEDENELVGPAREGTLRVLRAAREAGVRRVVLTSSFAAIGYGHPSRTRPFDETDWTDPEGPDVQPYIKSKTLAERAAWDFMEREGGTLELAVINPVGIFGPVLGPDLSGSIAIVQKLLDGSMPAVPKVHFGVVDVRDVVELHLRAMTAPEARNERFLAVAGASLSLHEVARILIFHLGERAARVPRRQLPNWLVRLAALRDPALKQVVPQLGRIRTSTSAKARTVLGWQPHSSEEALLATAESLFHFGLVGGRQALPGQKL